MNRGSFGGVLAAAFVAVVTVSIFEPITVRYTPESSSVVPVAGAPASVSATPQTRGSSSASVVATTSAVKKTY